MKITLRTRTFLCVAILVSTALQPVAVRSSNGIENRLHRVLVEFAVEQLDLPASDLVLEISKYKRALGKTVAFDELRVLPSRRPLSKGVQMVRFGLLERSKLVKDFQAKVKVRTFQNVLVAKTDLARHQKLTPDNLDSSRRETTRLDRNDFYAAATTVTGFRTKRLIKAGQIITRSRIERIPIVYRGSEVRIHFSKGALDIVLPGIAREDGHLGERVRVHCLENRRGYEAEIVDAHTVIVNLL